MTERNWAGNLTYSVARSHAPQTIDEARAIVMDASRIRAVGTRHAFNAIADSDGDLLSTVGLNRIIGLDPVRRTVTVEAGISYGRLATFLHGSGFALHNLASLPHISVGGAIATATHGSGDRNGNLATAVRALTIIDANGEMIALSRDSDAELFHASVVSLGALGIVATIELDIEPSFDVSQRLYENLAGDALAENFDALFSAAYSVSLFTTWRTDGFEQVWLKQRLSAGERDDRSAFFGAMPARSKLHPIAEMPADSCTPQLGEMGPWHERLPHFRLDFTPSHGDELQSEYFVPRGHAIAALAAIARLRERIAPLLLISEIRSIARDTLWLSPCHADDCVAIHFTWKPLWPEVQRLLPDIEAALSVFAARPHWGKLFTMTEREIGPLYPRLANFKSLAQKFDSQRKFRNAFLDTVIGA